MPAGNAAVADEADDLREEKLLLECQTEACTDGILSVDPDYRVLRANRAFLDMADLPNEVTCRGDGLESVRGAIRSRLAHPEEHARLTEQIHAQRPVPFARQEAREVLSSQQPVRDGIRATKFGYVGA
jgi:PAS domain-containing protein